MIYPPVMAANPDPAHITDAGWWFMEALIALEPGTQIGGIYANKAGYHNTGNANTPTDYSVRDLVDTRGPFWRTHAAAYDWTFPEAHSGDYRRMVKYGLRLRAAYEARDPRLNGWREALGQFDLDTAPEGIDFRFRFARVPDDSHRWHWHFSESREQVQSFENKLAMLSVLRGETLAQWRQIMATVDDLWRLLHDGQRPGSQTANGGVPIAWIVKRFFELEKDLATVNAALTAIQQRLDSAPGGNTDVGAVLNGVRLLLDTVSAELKAEVRDAIADSATGAANAVRGG